MFASLLVLSNLEICLNHLTKLDKVRQSLKAPTQKRQTLIIHEIDRVGQSLGRGLEHLEATSKFGLGLDIIGNVNKVDMLFWLIVTKLAMSPQQLEFL